MLVASLNANGIRAATRRGFGDWLQARSPDILGIQEMRCPQDQLPDVFDGYRLSYHQGNLPGRNGVALLTKAEPLAVRTGFGHSSDPEGRYLELDLPGLRVGCLYLPKGDVLGFNDSGDARYRHKMDFMEAFAAYLEAAAAQSLAAGTDFLVMGDFNIAHTRLDLKNWRGNQKASGFLPEEREWFSAILAPGTVLDVVRGQHLETPGPYTWWTWRGNAFERDTGWRIDYQLATPGLAGRAERSWVDKDSAQRISDHAPVLVEYR
ncbi:MAG: exodeoxyribonuclease III [Propionibacteriaceae bacterium]|jgi:exodeoxyribonuclease-3|nr:exodeoxyribonuclease III [Propionibacteriaceae bacterium]